jgi:hypothetical protein
MTKKKFFLFKCYHQRWYLRIMDMMKQNYCCCYWTILICSAQKSMTNEFKCENCCFFPQIIAAWFIMSSFQQTWQLGLWHAERLCRLGGRSLVTKHTTQPPSATYDVGGNIAQMDLHEERIILLSLIYLRWRRRRKHRRIWIHPIVRDRTSKGLFYTLFNQARQDVCALP